MNKTYTVREKFTFALLITGIICFGILFPDSLSTHDKLVHFAAHFGMSFLLALCFYLFGTVKLKISKSFTYAILISATLFIGIIYKVWEIATQGKFGNYPIHDIIDQAGVMISMSQNLAGLMGAILIIESLLDRNMIVSVLKSGSSRLSNATGIQNPPINGGSPSGSRFSPNTTEN